MDDNWRTAIGYICIMLCVVMWLGLLAWMVTPTEFTFKLEMDNNTRDAIESVEYPIANINEDQRCHNLIINTTGTYEWYECLDLPNCRKFGNRTNICFNDEAGDVLGRQDVTGVKNE